MTRSHLTGLFFVLAFAVLGGCTVEERTVVRAPPPDRVEVVTARPSPDHVWVRGRWELRGGDYIWIEGRWERR